MTAILVRGALQRQPPRHPHRPSSHRLGARPLFDPNRCQERGCRNLGGPVFLHGIEDGVYCGDHAEYHGFCRGCGQFSAGLESFDFSKVRGFCRECVMDMEAEERAEMGEDDWDYFDEDVP